MAYDSDHPGSEGYAGTAALPPHIEPQDRMTATEWLDVLRDQFRQDTWRAAIAAEALRQRVSVLHAWTLTPKQIRKVKL